jgi:glucose-6-phosphate isomerase
MGIGGSYLGARGVIDCLCSPNYNLKKKDTPNIYFAGNSLSDDSLQEIMDLLGDDDFSVNVISKSGTTTEPAVAFRFLPAICWRRSTAGTAPGSAFRHTDASAQRRSALNLADAEGWETFVIPDDVGGRYSVLTPVGLLPIAVAGVDTDALLEGAAGDDDPLPAGGDTNPAVVYAAARIALYRAGKSVELLAATIPASDSWASGGSSSSAKARARRARASSPPRGIHGRPPLHGPVHSGGPAADAGDRRLASALPTAS